MMMRPSSALSSSMRRMVLRSSSTNATTRPAHSLVFHPNALLFCQRRKRVTPSTFSMKRTSATLNTPSPSSSSSYSYLHWNTIDNPYATTAKWILSTAGLVVGMIHVGGLTRLTQSGLSMTTWSLTGSLPPMTKQAWQEEFDRYKTFPEWQQRQSMTLPEFQFIYAWEYGHRMLGRLVGVVYALPWMYLTATSKIPPGMQPRMFGLLAMGGTQGLVGWWMVKSGLGDDRRSDVTEIRVKPYRLATHLGMAMATYGALLWTGLDILSWPTTNNNKAMASSSVVKTNNNLPQLLQWTRRLKWASASVAGLVFTTVLSGALVAGQDAGRAYNTWPQMEVDGVLHWIPPPHVLWELTPWQRNLMETTATVQFNHRTLGAATAVGALGVAGVGVAMGSSASLPMAVTGGFYALGAAATAQFALGVTTLLNYVPLSMAAAHQLGSVVVFTSGVYLTHALRAYGRQLARGGAATATAAATGSGSATAAATTIAAATNKVTTRSISTASQNLMRPPTKL